MSYSRWAHSRWYTFWCAFSDEDARTKENCLFDVDCRFIFKYKELVEDIGACLKKVTDFWEEEHKEMWCGVLGIEKREVTVGPNPVSEEEREELRGYMLEFISDVDEEFKEDSDDEENAVGSGDAVDDGTAQGGTAGHGEEGKADATTTPRCDSEAKAD